MVGNLEQDATGQWWSHYIRHRDGRSMPARRKADQRSCDECGESFMAISYLKTRFCSNRCNGAFAARANGRGSNHPAWNGGRYIDRGGYVRVYVGEKRHALEHRVVLEEWLGRKLERWETVHHKNGDKTDNRLENLQLFVGNHGTGRCYRCSDCGSQRIESYEIIAA